MECTYDLFEVAPDGALMWRCAITGHDEAIAKLRQLSCDTMNEVRVMHVPSKSVIAVIEKVPRPQEDSSSG